MTRLEKLQALLEDSPDDEFLNYAVAMEHVAGSRSDDALAAFRRVLQVDPQHAAAFFQMAQLFARLGRVQEARNAATNGIAAARARGDQHAAEEITGYLDSLS